MKQLMIYAICLCALFSFAQNAKIDSLTLRLAYQNQDSTKIETSLLLIKELYSIKDYNKALLYIDQNTEFSKSLGYKKGLAENNYIRALILNNQNDRINAANYFKNAREYYSAINDTLGIAKVNDRLGVIEIERGNYKKGLQNSLSAISIFEEKDLKEDLSNAYNNLAKAYFNTNNLEKALQYNKKALSIREELDDLEGMKYILKNLGELYAQKNDYRFSIDNYERMLTLLDSEKDKNLRGEIMTSLGKSYLKINDLEKASDHLREGLAYSRRQKDELGILKSLNAFGDLNTRNNRLKLAENQLYKANKLCKELDNDEELLYNLKLNRDLDKKRSFFEDAFNWQNQYYALKEKLDRERLEAQAQNFQDTITDVSKVEELPLIEPKKETIAVEEVVKPESDNKEKTLLIYGLIAGLVFITALLIFIYLKNSKDTKIAKALTEENNTLALKNDQLEEVNQVKDKLFSIVSHDLKDSISSIKAFLDLLKDDDITKEEFNNLIPELSENANNASSLLFNLLNWSKSQMQNLQPKPELFNIQEIFQIKISLIEKKVNDKGIILIDESRREFVYADRSMLEIVIQNLITNAVKFTGKGDVITVSNQDYNGKVLICVEDTGIGISEENQKKLFNAKKNFTTIGTENEKGTGLGLTICKDLVELNNGRVWVESTTNIGSKFFIELPKAPLSE
ncbi:MAG: tetratricopeptide repeat-containing sensor histidine kinase [Winogradskyella sp.]|uniref:tetratricopeptide repeat-containing sensor histidine kinase n=1 Tax=Winogradskyella sp. TaxID=1883156 RepID=UPI0017EEE9B1|nr:tetratricopeptide repeat-containing sensor histidine kinase [Winogradskyella sp.]MBT8243900.1 tetratricopeptide repeat-containing sensor histidine kinase [Winogradskyella sp.]NNK22337.1 tetratricopeptide repeat-containing sensor histidine kinase [Winogradskyella sp.]